MPRTRRTPSEEEFILSSKNMSGNEVIFMTTNYYLAQDMRKRIDMQLRHLPDKHIGIIDEETGAVRPMIPPLLASVAQTFWDSERNAAKALTLWVEQNKVGQWCMSIPAVGPIITAGLLAHIDITKAPVVANIWTYAGLNTEAEWPSGEEATAKIKEVVKKGPVTEDHVAVICSQLSRRFDTVLRYSTTDAKGNPIKLTVASLARALSRRPFNAELKQVCFHLGECIKRGHKDPDSIYGPIYRQCKAKVVVKNERGQNAERAKTFYTNSSEVRAKLKQGKLPDGNLDRQACNQTVKIFLSHLQAIMYWDKYGKAPPRPFAEEHLGHAHMFKVPHMEMFPGFEKAYYGKPLDPELSEKRRLNQPPPEYRKAGVNRHGGEYRKSRVNR